MLPLEGISPITDSLLIRFKINNICGLTDAVAGTTGDLLAIGQLLASTEINEIGIVTGTISQLHLFSQE
jgi:energy-converting hydrogenase Eha subunit H